MSWFKQLFEKKHAESVLRDRTMVLHGRIVERVLTLTQSEPSSDESSNPLQIKDDFILRFDVMVLMVSSVLHHLHHFYPSEKDLSQSLWELTFESFEESLRDRGVMDVRIGARMGTLFQNATGRRNAYLQAWDDEDPIIIRKAIARNVLNGAEPLDDRVDIILKALSGFPESVVQ